MTKLDIVVNRDKVYFSDYDRVIVKRSGNIHEIRSAVPSREIKIKLLNKDEVKSYGCDECKKYFLRLDTGEIKECSMSDSRQDNYSGVLATISCLRDIINANSIKPSSLRWITLTYRQRENENEEAVPMRDTKRLYLNFKHFVERLRLDYPTRKIEFIKVAEPQRSGSWHLHVILIFNGKAPFIRNDVLREYYWRQGFVDIQSVGRDCDNLGAYFSSYLTNIEYEEGDILNEGEKLIDINNKKYIKGGRLKFYPSGFNLYSTSRGINQPEEVETFMKYVDLESLGMLTDVKEVYLFDMTTGYSATYRYLYFNKARRC